MPDSKETYARIVPSRKEITPTLTLNQFYQPWGGCGFQNKQLDLNFKRLEDGTVQIHLDIMEWKGEKMRLYEMVGTMVLKPELAKTLIQYLEGELNA